MIEGFNFPVKYAVLELIEDGGYIYNYEPVIRGYIATKCYVIEDVVSYRADGTNSKFYRVFFPNKNFDTFKSCYKNNIDYRIKHGNFLYDIYGKIRNLDTVYALYDSYEDAKSMADYKNEKFMFETIVSNVILDNDYEKNAEIMKSELKNEFDICNKFEEELNKTFDIENGIKLVR